MSSSPYYTGSEKITGLPERTISQSLLKGQCRKMVVKVNKTSEH
jgi:hypothetical protein